MPKLVFYRQCRVDGGIRTGIDVDGAIAYGLFEEGDSDDNPRLRWFVDLRCEGPRLPKSDQAARKWFLDHAEIIKDGFARCAEEIRAGIDPEQSPFFWSDFADVPTGVSMKIVVAAVRRQDAIEMAGIMREIGSSWERFVRQLKRALPAGQG